MFERYRNIHPQLRKIYGEIYDELRREGLSDEEAQRRMSTDFDWSLSSIRKPLLRPREDEFADSEKARDKAADCGRDLSQVWLYLKLGGVSQRQLDQFCTECAEFDYPSALYWVLCKGLMQKYIYGQKLNSVEQAED